MSERTLKAASAANSRVPLRRSKLRRKTATSSSRPLSKPSTSHTALTKASAGVPSSSCEHTTLVTCNSLPLSVQVFQLRQPNTLLQLILSSYACVRALLNASLVALEQSGQGSQVTSIEPQCAWQLIITSLQGRGACLGKMGARKGRELVRRVAIMQAYAFHDSLRHGQQLGRESRSNVGTQPFYLSRCCLACILCCLVPPVL